MRPRRKSGAEISTTIIPAGRREFGKLREARVSAIPISEKKRKNVPYKREKTLGCRLLHRYDRNRSQQDNVLL